MSITPCRKAAWRTVSSSSAWISSPTGSNRTVCRWAIPRRLGLDSGLTRPGRRLSVARPVQLSFTSLLARGRREAAAGPATLVLGDVLLPLLRRHLVERDVGAREGEVLHVVERPELLLVVEVEVRLGHQRLAVVADVAEVLDDVREVPVVVQGLPLSLAGEAAHRRRRAALVLRPERGLVGPVAGRRAVGAHLSVDLVDDHVLADQARDHAGPAPVRVLVVDVFEGDRPVAVGVTETVVVLPPLPVLGVPARVLVFEPLEVLVGHPVDAPVVDGPAGGEELGHLVDVALVPDAVPCLLNEVVRHLQAILLEWHQVAAAVVVVDPAPPRLRVAL